MKKWLICLALGIATIVLINLIINEGVLSFSVSDIPMFVVFSLLFTLIYRFFSIYIGKDAAAHARQARENNEQGEGVEFQISSGVPNMQAGTCIQLFFEEKNLLIKEKFAEQTARLAYTQITDAHLYTETEIRKKQRSPGSRAFWGAILGGETGAIVGGFSGMKDKEKVMEKKFLIIVYTSDGADKQVVLSVTHASLNVGREKVVAKLREKAGLPVFETVGSDIHL